MKLAQWLSHTHARNVLAHDICVQRFLDFERGMQTNALVFERATLDFSVRFWPIVSVVAQNAVPVEWPLRDVLKCISVSCSLHSQTAL